MRNRNRYPENWYSVIRPTVLSRDKFRCTSCKIKQGVVGYYDHQGIFHETDEWLKEWAIKNGYKPKKVHLQVCHLNNDVTDNDLSNLSAKCPKCHLKHDAEYRRLSRIADKAKR